MPGRFNPKSKYDVVSDKIPIKEFSEFSEEFVKRPPYQRKSVWSRKKQQSLLDSLFREYYVPRVVLREVRLDDERDVREVIDGQQRIETAVLFIEDKLPLPETLEDIDPRLPKARFSELPPDLRRFANESLKYDVDIVKRVDDPKDSEHQSIATEIFRRLQEGESLTYMEVAYASLSSLSRNFVVKYADDGGFDYQRYEFENQNPHKHQFFNVIDSQNDRMQHLALLTRLLILEEHDGPANIRNTDVGNYIDIYQRDDGIGNMAFEDKPQAKETLQTMNLFYDICREDYMSEEGKSALKELRREYFVVSMYLLLRHLRKVYVFNADERELFRKFIIDLYQRLKSRWGDEAESDLIMLSDSRQQTVGEIEERHRIMRQLFFDFAKQHEHEMLTKDKRRTFNEAERIYVYRRDEGLCRACIAEGKPEAECHVPWREYEADHVIPYTKGGPTETANAQLLCKHHNQIKGAVPS